LTEQPAWRDCTKIKTYFCFLSENTSADRRDLWDDAQSAVFEGIGANMKSRLSIASRIAAAVTTLALAWLVTPTTAQNLDLDTSASIMGCGTATNIGHANTAPLYVDGFPCISPANPIPNVAYTNVKICAPGNKTNCQVIDHVQIDTGSVGLRIASSAVNSSLLQAMPYIPTSGPQILTNCVVFGSLNSLYGPVQIADVYIADKVARNVSLQIFGQNLTPPRGCGSPFSPPQGVSQFGANGLLGIALGLSVSETFYSCNTDGSSCQPGPSPTTPNLVSQFQNDDNGVTIALNALPPSGSTEPIQGLLIFGVGTQADNTPPAGTVALQADPSSGRINLRIGNTTAPALIDSGTSLLLVNDPSLQPTATVRLGLSSYNATTPAYTVDFTVGDADTVMNNAVISYDAAADGGVGLSILGLPLFFGRTMYFVFDGKQSPLGTGPINAMWPQPQRQVSENH
jgi:Protein of unknown function (DUF3443)